MDTPDITLRRRRTHRLIPTRYPSAGILDRVASPADLDAVFELEAWTNDRVSNELGVLLRIPRDEWVVGSPMASVVMAAFCHPRPGGARFSSEARGAWYASFSLETAHVETAYHRRLELIEIGVTDARLQMREYTASFSGRFCDVRSDRPGQQALHDPSSYEHSQRFAEVLVGQGANGVVYRSVRHEGGTCLACFRPLMVRDVSIGGHFEYRWTGAAHPVIRRLKADA